MQQISLSSGGTSEEELLDDEGGLSELEDEEDELEELELEEELLELENELSVPPWAVTVME